MIRRFFQFWSVLFMSFVVLRYVADHAQYGFARDYWQEIYFVIIAVTTAWLIAVTRSLRPVVVLFAAAGFFVIAMMEDPSGASFLAALDDIGDRVLAVAES